MDEALEQLFSYLVWRDTKAAVLLFIRNVDITAVIEKAIDRIKQHPYYKRTRPTPDDDQYEFTIFRLRFAPISRRQRGSGRHMERVWRADNFSDLD
jgi:hypothetical protein